MGYATLSHVESLNAARGAFTSTTVPSASQVVGYLQETAAVIDSLLAGRGFNLPVPTGATSALKLLEIWNAKGAHALVEAAAQNSPVRDQAEAAWQTAQKMLLSIEPVGLVRDSTTTYARAPAEATAYFGRDMEL